MGGGNESNNSNTTNNNVGHNIVNRISAETERRTDLIRLWTVNNNNEENLNLPAAFQRFKAIAGYVFNVVTPERYLI